MKQHMSKQYTVCTSVFKSGESTDRKKKLTIKWIELINRAEKIKEQLSNSSDDKPFSI